jgi:hypothetical protein
MPWVGDDAADPPCAPADAWNIERTNGWHNNFNRLQRCYERREAVAAAFFDLPRRA